MIITKHEVKNGKIHISNAVRLLTMGIHKNIVTIWAVTDPLTKQGISMDFLVKNDQDQVTIGDCESYITSFINDDGVWHLFGVEKAAPPRPPLAGPAMPPAAGPGGEILTQ